MQVVPGNAFQNTVPGAAAAPPSSPQPTTNPQSKAPDHAVKAAGRLHAALTAAGQKPHGPGPQGPQPQGRGSPVEFRPNAPRGSALDIVV